MVSRSVARPIMSKFYKQCPVCGFSERHLVSCVIAQIEAETETLLIRKVALDTALNKRGYHPPELCPSDWGSSPCYYCEVTLSEKNCICGGPSAQPCGPNCDYPYTDQEVPFHG